MRIKKIIIILLMTSILSLTLTGCDKKQENKTKENSTKTITLTDNNFGYKTTFTYNKEEKYSEVEEENGGKSKEISFENEDLDLSYQMYYTDMYQNRYKETQETRKAQKYYKEYKFGKYEAYAYGEYSSGLYLNILLETDKEEDKAKILFVSIDRLDSNQDIVVADVVADKKVQDFFNSLKFEKIK